MSLTETTIKALSDSILALDPGPLAELRRMNSGGVGVPIFWRLAAQCDLTTTAEVATYFMQLVRIMAILVPAGQRDPTIRLHDPSRPLGQVLCDGGDPAWPGGDSTPRPATSEGRLARLMTMPTSQRGAALERLARMLARSRSAQSGVNCNDFAALILPAGDAGAVRKLAQTYYLRLDRALRSVPEKGTEQ